MTALACPTSTALTLRALTHWERFREADAFARRAICTQLAPAEAAGLAQLEQNLAALPPVGDWFEWESAASSDYRVKPGIVAKLLSGLTLEERAAAELVRACRPTGAAIGALLNALQEPAAEIDPFAEIPGPEPTAPRIVQSQAQRRINTLLSARITTSEGTGLTEHLAELVDRWGVDLTCRVPVETLNRLCQETNNKPGTVRRHLARIQKERGITGKLPPAYAGAPRSACHQHAHSVALAVAEALYIEAENTPGDRAALLLEAATLLREVLK